MTYALGREPALADRAVIDGILNDLSSNNGGFKDLIRAMVHSESFADMKYVLDSNPSAAC